MSTTKNTPPSIDFDSILSQGPESYNKVVGEWWQNQAANRAHKSAYHHIAEYLKVCLGKKSNRKLKILDFACGDCNYMEIMAKHFPKAQFYGVDGSHKMLTAAKARLEGSGLDVTISPSHTQALQSNHQITLIQSYLPKFNLFPEQMDVVVYLFPNMTCGTEQQDYYNKNGYRNK